MAKKNVAFKIRVDEELKKAFLEVCSEMDIPAAQVVRGFMKQHVDKYNNEKQPALFEIKSISK